MNSILSNNVFSCATLFLLSVASTEAMAGPCRDALVPINSASVNFAHEKLYPLACNWTLIGAFERKMVEMGDLKHGQQRGLYHKRPLSVAVKKAQRRLNLEETGKISLRLFQNYMSLQKLP